jgi:hypothetical protein
VVDPRRIKMTEFADHWLRPNLGTDVAWINGMMHVIIKEDLHDKAFVEERTENFDELKATVEKYTPEHVETITGIPAQQLIETAARIFTPRPRRPASCTAWASPSTPRGPTTLNPWPTWPCSAATWASGAAASIRCAGRTTFRGPATWAACPTSYRLPAGGQPGCH